MTTESRHLHAGELAAGGVGLVEVAAEPGVAAQAALDPEAEALDGLAAQAARHGVAERAVVEVAPDRQRVGGLAADPPDDVVAGNAMDGGVADQLLQQAPLGAAAGIIRGDLWRSDL